VVAWSFGLTRANLAINIQSIEGGAAAFDRETPRGKRGVRNCLVIMAAAGTWLGADQHFSVATTARNQSDQIGILLRTVPDRPDPGEHMGTLVHVPPVGMDKNKNGRLIRAPMTLRAGQSIIVRAGASSLTASGQTAPVVFRLGRRPTCGAVWETSQGIVLETQSECAGQTLELDYEVSLAGAATGQQASIRVEAEAVVQSGVSSCGIADAPYEFISVPGGSYSLKNAPGQLGDLLRLLPASSADVDAFCITEEAIPESEMEAFLAAQAPLEMRDSFPEALDAPLQISAQVEVGRGMRPPALAVSHRMAKAYARRQSGLLDRRIQLPQLDQYVAAAVYLLRQQPDATSTNSFLVSLRGGLLEWTDTPCNASNETFVALGTGQQSGLLDRYCYEASQRVGRMGFRLVTRAGPDVGSVSRPSK
jgi:hypothetical protein